MKTAHSQAQQVWYDQSHAIRKEMRHNRIVEKLKRAHRRWLRHQEILRMLQEIEIENQRMFKSLFERN